MGLRHLAFGIFCHSPYTRGMSEVWTVRRLLEWTKPFFERKEVDSPRLSAELLLSHVLGVARIKLYTDYERPLTETQLAAYRELVRRAGEQEPVAYLTGRAHFFNLELEITREVLIPRPDTETLVEQALAVIKSQPGLDAPRVLDLCTGSGCIAAAIASRSKLASVVAVEISPPAVALARQNINRLGFAERVTVLHGDLYAPLAELVDHRPFDLIVANPPYIASGIIDALDRSVKDYEPHSALDGGADGLEIHRRILAGLAERLVGGGHVFLEIAFDQGAAAKQLAIDAGLGKVRIIKDSGGHERVIAGQHLPNQAVAR